MNYKNGVLANTLESLMKFPDVTGKTGFAIMRNIRILETELKDFRDARMNLFKKYGKSEDGGKTYQIGNDDPGYQEFMSEYNKLLDIEIDVSPFRMDASEIDLQYSEQASVKDYIVVQDFISNRQGQSE